MTLSTAQLDTLFTNVNEGQAPDAATQLLLAAYAQQTIGGGITDAAALSLALHIPPPADGSVGSNTPENTTDVALAVYQFFTGMAPTLNGLDFLVNNDGGAPLNPNDLDSAYYAGFNQANRYYNFAINLITGNPGVAASFAATYGAASFNTVVTAAYESIVGTPNVGAAHAAAAIAAIEAQLGYFQMVAAERAPAVNQDLATKAIAIAFILEEAIKADVGYYAFAIDSFNTLLAANPEAAIPGMTAGGVDLLTSFPIITVGQTFTLTPGVDTITPPATDNNTVNGTEATFTPFDSIDLGATTGNVFNWVDASTANGFVNVTPVDAVVKGVQTFNVSSASAGVFADVTGFVGLQVINADIFSFEGTSIDAGPGTAVNLLYTDIGNEHGQLDVTGGSVVTIEQDDPHYYTPSIINVDGGPGTTEVDITQKNDAGAITIDDHFTTIASVTLTGDSTSVTINGGAHGVALSTLSVIHGDPNITINDGGGSPATLNLNLDHAFITLSDSGSYTGINIALAAPTPPPGAGGWNEELHLFTNFTDAIWPTFSMTGLKTETVSGTGVLGQNSENLSALESIIVSGAAGFLDDFRGAGHTTLDELADNFGDFTSFDASASSGKIYVNLDAALTTFKGGSGMDLVMVEDDAAVSIAGGSFALNEIVFNLPGGALTAGGTYAMVTGFPVLGTGNHSSGVYDLQGFSNPGQISDVDVLATPAGALTFANTAQVQTLTIDAGLGASGGITLLQGAAAAASGHDVLNLIVGVSPGEGPGGGIFVHQSTNGIDTSDVGSGFVNSVGTDVSVAEHSGNLAPFTATTTTFTAGAAATTWHEVFTFTATPNGGTFDFNDTAHGHNTAVTFTSSVTSTDLAFIVSQINANDPEVTASFSGSVLTVTSNTSGVAGNFTAPTITDGGGAAETHVVTAGTDATAATGTMTVTHSDLVTNMLSVADSAGLIGNINLVGGESLQTIADDITALLNGHGFTASDGGGTSTTISFTYPDATTTSLGTTDFVAQVDTLDISAATVVSGDQFRETFTDITGSPFTVEYTATGGDTPTTVATALTAAINASGASGIVATSAGAQIYVTTAVGDANKTFTTSPVQETSFNIVEVGSQAITANGYQTVNLGSHGTGAGGTNLVFLIDNALTDLNISGPENLALVTSGATLLSHIDTTGMTNDAFVDLLGVLASEVTTGITASLGNTADVTLYGNANAGSTDVISGGSSDVTFFGTGQGSGTGSGGNSIVNLGDGFDSVVLYSGTHNSVTLGNHIEDNITDHSNGADTLKVGNGNFDTVTYDGTGTVHITAGDGHNDTVTLGEGSGTAVVTMGNGDNDTVVLGDGSATVTFGSGAGDTVVFDTDGVGVVTFGGGSVTADFGDVFGPSFAIATTTSQVSILTNALDTITGLVAGDQINLPSVGDTLGAPAHNLAGVAGEVVFTTGDYNVGAGTFTYDAHGHDALMSYDGGGGNIVQVVLVGGAAEEVHATISGHVVTF